jgi:hypothetical protein
MIADQVRLQDARVQTALDELRRLIQECYPTASFEIRAGEDPSGIYLVATVDTDDIGDVIELVTDRLVTMQVDERLPVYVVPVHTPEQIRERLRARQQALPDRAPVAT